jgi:hypothetical protein
LPLRTCECVDTIARDLTRCLSGKTRTWTQSSAETAEREEGMRRQRAEWVRQWARTQLGALLTVAATPASRRRPLPVGAPRASATRVPLSTLKADV